MGDINNPTENNDILKMQIEAVKKFLKNWTYVILYVFPVMIWKKKWDPFILIAVITSSFLLFWVVNCNLLLKLSIITLIINSLNFFFTLFFQNITYKDEEEAIYTEFCSVLVITYMQYQRLIKNFYQFSEKEPILYYISTLLALIIFIPILSHMTDLFFMYMITVFLVMWPGFKKNVYPYINNVG